MLIFSIAKTSSHMLAASLQQLRDLAVDPIALNSVFTAPGFTATWLNASAAGEDFDENRFHSRPEICTDPLVVKAFDT